MNNRLEGKPPPYNRLVEDHPPQGGYQPPPPHGYPPPQAGYPPPPQAGYPPPQAGYPPQQAGYPPQQAGYPPQQQPHGYPPHVYHQPQPVMVINNQPAPRPAQNTTVVVNSNTTVRRDEINHCLHCVISLFFFPWLLVWFCLCICN